MSERAARRRQGRPGEGLATRAAAYLAQPYVRELERAKALGFASGAIPLRPGTVHYVEVRHDGDCPKLRGGLCRCQPELELVTRLGGAA